MKNLLITYAIKAMKTRLSMLFFILVICSSEICADIISHVKIGDLYYNLDTSNRTAEVTYQSKSSGSVTGDTYNEGWGITSAIIPSTVIYHSSTYSVKSIGNFAFDSCDSLTSVDIPSGVETIGKYAFSGCSRLDSLIIPNSVTSINYDAFANCSSLTYVTLSNNLTTIAGGLFYNCTSLASITIPEGVVTIGSNAFVGCKLSVVTLPASLSNIGDYIHPSFPSNRIFSINYSGSLKDWCEKKWNPTYVCKDYPLLINGELQENILLPDDITTIGGYAFSTCGSLRSLTIPSSVTRIDAFAFQNCQYFYSLTIHEGVTVIGEGAFWGCPLGSVTIPNSVNTVNKAAFRNCYYLKSVQLSNNMSHINLETFKNCHDLTSITIPNVIEHIEGYAFEGCYGLTSVSLSNRIKNINGKAFKGCSSLKSITIPSSVERIDCPFGECSSLENIILLPESPPHVSTLGIDSVVPVYVPCGALEAYQATNWSNYNLQYQPYSFKLNVTPLEPHKGLVDIQWGNTCEASSLSAVPNEGFYFIQWSDGILDNPRTITFTQDTTIAAIFGPFTVRFVDDNDTILSSQEYEYGEKPVSPADPVKTNTAQYSYTFAGWTPKIVTVTKDKTYKATYTSTLNKYIITFMNGDSVLSADLWEYGKKPIYRGKKPTKAEDDKYTYTFNGWSPEIVAVVSDATYMATFTAVEKIEAVDNVYDRSTMPSKIVDNGTVYILMPNGKKYSMLGELIK